MLINKNRYGYSKYKRHITGRGFVDTFKNIASFVSSNKDLVAKPLLSAVGTLAATGLTSGVPALLSRISNRNKGKSAKQKIPDDPKYKEILQNMMTRQSEPAPVTNIIGSGARGRTGDGLRRSGAGIKTF